MEFNAIEPGLNATVQNRRGADRLRTIGLYIYV